MMHDKILHTALAATALAALFGSLTTMATAQTTAPVHNDNAYTAPASSLMAPPMAGDSDSMKAESSTIAPLNVLEDLPRDMSGKPAQTLCDSNPVTGPMPIGCRRWSEIAGTL
jgi:hypothetical protein